MESRKMQNDFMKEFFNVQEKGLDMWKEGMEKAKEIYPSNFLNVNNFINPMEAYEKWSSWQNDFMTVSEDNPMAMLNKWIKKNQEMFTSNANSVEANHVKDVFNKMSGGLASYTNLFSFWQDLQAHVGENDTIQNIQEFVNKWKDKYVKMLSDSALLEIPSNITELTKDPMKLFKAYYESNFNFMDPLSMISKEYFEKSPFANNDYVESYKTYMKTLEEFFTVFREKIAETMESIILDYQKMVKGGSIPKTFKEFYSYWFNKNNEVINGILETEEFSKLLARLSKESLNYKKNYDMILEKQMEWMPFPLKSDMKSLYKTIYDLRKEVKSLKKQINEFEKVSK